MLETRSARIGMTDANGNQRSPLDRGAASPVDNLRLDSYYKLVWEDESKRQPPFSPVFSPTGDSFASNSERQFDAAAAAYDGRQVPQAHCYADAAPGAGGDNSGTGAKAGHGDERPTGDEQELATKMLQIQSKRFYLDVKQNWRGRFIKIAEVSAGGRKSRLLMSMQAAGEFKHHLDEFVQFYEKLDAPDPAAALPEDGQLMSRVMVKENRRYYIDLKENNRGRFLRVTQTARTAPALAAVYGGGPGVRREQIAIPAEGLAQLAVALAELTADFACDDSGIDASASLPDSRQLRADNKFFFFDFGQNSRGVFLRISEVRNNFRSAITIPERSWSQFGDIFAEVCASGAAGSSRSASAAAVTPDALDSDTQGVPKSPSSG